MAQLIATAVFGWCLPMIVAKMSSGDNATAAWYICIAMTAVWFKVTLKPNKL